MKFRLLGPLEVEGATASAILTGQRLPAMLATLLLHANRTVTVRQLAAGTWAESPRAVSSNVRTYVAQLRAALAAVGDIEHRVITEPAGYRLSLQPCELDLTQFDDLAGQGIQALDRAEPEAAQEMLGRALSLWRGEALGGIDGGPLLRAELARLDERRLAITERWVDAALAAGRHAEMVAELRRLVRIHPLREQLWGRLMLALSGCGDRAAALDAYREAYRLLASERGIEPSGHLKHIHQLVLRNQ